METNFETLLSNVSEQVKDMAQTKTIIGEEFTMGEYTCKPVIKVGVGFGGGGGNGKDSKSNCDGKGAAALAAMGISPVGFLISKGDEISFISANKRKGLQTFMEKVPDLVEKIMDIKQSHEKEEGKKKEKK